MADRLGITESQLSQVIGKTPSKRIGSKMARKIEAQYGLPKNSLDQLTQASEESMAIAREIESLPPATRKTITDLLKTLKK